MGIFGMLTTGASGMNAQANRLGAISDNIANAETTGYKTAGAQFSSLLLPSGLSQYNSGSVNTTITHAISMQGPLLDAALVTDLAVQGPGFYLVNATPSTVSANPTVMTRAGDLCPGRRWLPGQRRRFWVDGIQFGCKWQSCWRDHRREFDANSDPIGWPRGKSDDGRHADREP